MDFPVARALACEIVSEQPYQPIGDAAQSRARALMHACRCVYAPLRTFGPMNEGNRLLIAEAAEKTGKIVTVENHSIIGGLGSAVCEVVADKAPCCVARIGYQDIFLQCGDDNVLFHRYGMDAEGIATKAASLVQTR